MFDINKIGKFIGEGSNGIVYAYDKNKVIKFTSHSKEYIKTQKYIIKHRPKYFVKTYSVGKLTDKNCRELIKNEIDVDDNCTNSFLIMERLKKLNRSEENAIQDILYDEKQQTKNIKLKRFLNKYSELDNIHNDAHEGNVMKNKYGDYKLIDLEYVSLKKLKKYYNGTKNRSRN